MIGTASLSAAACSRITWPIRGCWTTARHSAEVSADGFSRISWGTATLPTSWRSAAVRIRSISTSGRASVRAIASTIVAISGDGWPR